MNPKKEYYGKRVEIIKKIILELIDMAMLPKGELMNYKYNEFKKLDKLFAGEFRGSIIFINAFPKKKDGK
jgi:hypothetical protein